MGTKVKGLFKGLRYISHIFDEKEDNKEMEIGLPTDVKHVAHIGMDGPSANTPTWMKEFKPTQDSTSGTANAAEGGKDSSSTKTIQGTPDSALQIINQIPKSRRPKDNDGPKNHRKSHSRGSSADSLNQEGSSRTRRHRKSKQSNDLISQDGAPPKHSRRKSKESFGDGGSSTSRRSRKSRDQGCLTDIPFTDQGSEDSEFGHGLTNKENDLRQF